MEKYIDVEEFKKELIDHRNFYPVIIKNALESMPAADVEKVVRCESCVNRNTYSCPIFNTDAAHWFGDKSYCSMGEIK